MKLGDLALIKEGHRKYFTASDDIPTAGIVGIFLGTEVTRWSDEFSLYRFLTDHGCMELVLEKENRSTCFEVLMRK